MEHIKGNDGYIFPYPTNIKIINDINKINEYDGLCYYVDEQNNDKLLLIEQYMKDMFVKSIQDGYNINLTTKRYPLSIPVKNIPVHIVDKLYENDINVIRNNKIHSSRVKSFDINNLEQCLSLYFVMSNVIEIINERSYEQTSTIIYDIENHLNDFIYRFNRMSINPMFYDLKFQIFDNIDIHKFEMFFNLKTLTSINDYYSFSVFIYKGAITDPMINPNRKYIDNFYNKLTELL